MPSLQQNKKKKLTAADIFTNICTSLLILYYKPIKCVDSFVLSDSTSIRVPSIPSDSCLGFKLGLEFTVCHHQKKQKDVRKACRENTRTRTIAPLRGQKPFTDISENLSNNGNFRDGQEMDDDNDDEIRTATPKLTAQEIAKCNTLPRLYVGELPNSLPLPPPSHQNLTSKLNSNLRLSLSIEQTHYLTKVMRFFKKRKKRSTSAMLSSNSLSYTTMHIDGGAETEIVKNVDISQCVRLFDGLNGEWLAKITEPSDSMQSNSNERSKRSKRTTRTRTNSSNVLEAQCLIQLRRQQSEPYKQPWVIFAPIKKQRLKLLVEKCTELGTQLFCPIMTDHTEAGAGASLGINMETTKNDDAQNQMFMEDSKSKGTEMDKIALISCEAAEQSERLTVPTFVTSLENNNENDDVDLDVDDEMVQNGSIDKLLKNLDSSPVFTHRTLLVCRERQHTTVPILEAFNIIKTASKDGTSIDTSDGVVLLVGPEGGWSEHENEIFDEYNSKYPDKVMMCVSLGSSIVLRAETAAMAAVASYVLWNDNESVNKN